MSKGRWSGVTFSSSRCLPIRAYWVPSAPGKSANMLSNVWFSLTMKSTCLMGHEAAVGPWWLGQSKGRQVGGAQEVEPKPAKNSDGQSDWKPAGSGRPPDLAAAGRFNASHWFHV